MKYAFMTFSTPTQTLEEILALVCEYGYDGLEPRLDAGHAHGIEVDATPARRAELRSRCAEAGVPLACLATSLRFVDADQAGEMLVAARERIDLACDVGCPRLRVFGGRVPAGTEREQAVDTVAAGLAGLADHAEARGVTLCMETHDDWCHPGDVAAVMTHADHPAVGVNWDIMHPVRMGLASIDESFDMLRPWIRHVHVHDGVQGEQLRLVPIGEGQIDHRQALKRLAEAGYEGFISGEWIDWEPYDRHLPRELATLQQYERGIA